MQSHWDHHLQIQQDQLKLRYHPTLEEWATLRCLVPDHKLRYQILWLRINLFCNMHHASNLMLFLNLLYLIFYAYFFKPWEDWYNAKHFKYIYLIIWPLKIFGQDPPLNLSPNLHLTKQKDYSNNKISSILKDLKLEKLGPRHVNNIGFFVLMWWVWFCSSLIGSACCVSNECRINWRKDERKKLKTWMDLPTFKGIASA